MSSVQDFHRAIGFRVYSVTNTTPQAIQTVFNAVDGTKATFTVLGADIRYRYDGEDPSTTTGHYLSVGLQHQLFGHENLDQFKMIAITGTAEITVTVEAVEQV